MASGCFTPEKVEQISSRHQARYWKSQFERTRERARLAQEELKEVRRELRRTRRELRARETELEALTARLRWFERQLFGIKSESGAAGISAGESEECQGAGDEASSDPIARPLPRCRGQQRGSKGHGRIRRSALPSEEVIHELSEQERRCPRCGKPFRELKKTEDSEEYVWQATVCRRVHRRRRYEPACACRATPGVIAAPGPAKLIPRGAYGVSFWVQVIVERYALNRPLQRICKQLSLYGFPISAGTLTGGLERLAELVRPLYQAIVQRVRDADCRHMDETSWKMFVRIEGKESDRWWLWVFSARDAVAFVLDRTRSRKVVKGVLGEEPAGMCITDGYAAYRDLGPKVLSFLCWAHLRRRFINAGAGFPRLAVWADEWVAQINWIFSLNRLRLEFPLHSADFATFNDLLVESLEDMERRRDEELARPDGHPQARKVLMHLKTHWSRYILFVTHPEAPMDNNEAERQLRDPVIARKLTQGSRSLWGGQMMAMMCSLFQTLAKCGVNVYQYLTRYFECCAQAGGRPPRDLAPWLPWNVPESRRVALPLPAEAPREYG